MRNHISLFAVMLAASAVNPVVAQTEDAAGYVKIAKAHLEKHEFDKAIADCNKALDLDFNSADAYNTRARGWVGKAACDNANNAEDAWRVDCAKALDDCDDALQIDAKFADAYVSRACVRISKGEFIAAGFDCDKAVALDPKSARAYCTRAHISVFTSQDDKNIADCDRALELDPKLAEAYNNRATGWLNKGAYDKAVADCDKALALDSTLELAFVTRGLAWAYRGEHDKAIVEYKRALQVTPNEWRAINDLGVAKWQLAQMQETKAASAAATGDEKTAKECRDKSDSLKKEAVSYWMRGVAAHPRTADIHSNLGYAYSEAFSRAATSQAAAENLDRAEFHLRKAVACNPSSSRPHNNYGRVLLRRSQKYEADASAAEAKGTSDPSDLETITTLKKLAREKRDAAVSQFQMAAMLEPSLLEAKLNLGEVYQQVPSFDKAKAQYQMIEEIEEKAANKPRDLDDLANFSQAHFGLARIAIAQDHSEEAIRQLKRASELNPSNMSALELFAKYRYERAEYNEGEKCLASWLAKMPPAARQKAAEQFVKQLDDAGKDEAAEQARKAGKKLEEHFSVIGKKGDGGK